MKLATFALGFVITLLAFGTKKPQRMLLFLLSFYFIFNLGWVFYHYTGLLLVDFPIFALLVHGANTKGNFKFSYPKISAPAIGIIIWGVITGALAIEFGWALAELSMIVRAYLVFVCVANHVKTQDDLKVVMNGLLAGVAFEAFMAVWQWRMGPSPLMPFINEQYHRWRATGTFYVPHYLGNYLVLVLPILFRLFLFYKPNNKNETIRNGIFLGLGAIAMLVTFARGPWMSFAGCMSVMLLLSLLKSKYRPKVKWAVGLLIVFGGAFLMRYASTIENQFTDDRQDAAMIRFDQFRIARRLIADNLVFGTGIGNYELVSPNYVYDYERLDPRSWQFSEMVHNSYLFFTAQLGVPGILMFFWGVFAVFRLGLKVVQSPIPYFSNIGFGILTGFLGIGIAFLAGPDIKAPQLLVQIGLLVGVLIALTEQEKILRKRALYLRQQQRQEREKIDSSERGRIA